MKLNTTKVIILLLTISLTILPMTKAQDDYPVVYVDFVELRLVPEDITDLVSSIPLFTTDPTLALLLTENDTLFWEGLGQTGMDLSQNDSVSTIAIIQLNESGFFQTLVGLSLDNDSVLWTQVLDIPATGNFSVVTNDTVQFFVDQDKYWGLCEEIVLLPAHLNPHDVDIVWRFTFHLVEDSERWVLYVDTAGQVVDSHVTTIPCESCSLCPLPIIVGISVSIVIVVVVVLFKKGIISRSHS
ncbi:MAG: hypothetical protein RTU30_06730 [Candidatus Thorarchaeota archaeon]